MLKLFDFVDCGNDTISATVEIEGNKDNCFEVIFNDAGDILKSTASQKERVYESQARIAFKKYLGKPLPKEIVSMWY